MNLKFNTKTIVYLFLFFASSQIYGQQKMHLKVSLDTLNHTLTVNQSITFTNSSKLPLTKLILNDWNNAYYDKNSALGKRFSDEFVRSFHLSTTNERGYTIIEKIKINNDKIDWNRVNNQIDLIEIPLKNSLATNDSVSIELDYFLKIPDAKFTRFGFDKGNYYLKECFLNIARINEDGDFVLYSNENLEDASNEPIKDISVEFTVPLNYVISSNLKTESTTVDKTYLFSGNNSNEILFALEKKISFESFTNEAMEVESNIHVSRVNDIEKAIIIDKIVNYFNQNLGESSSKKILVSQIDYERNPFYGLNQLPSFLSPFPNTFLFELKFLKAYSSNYLKQNLKIDFRKDHYIFDAIQTYMLMNYIEENYPDLTLIGNISKYKLFKSYELSKAKFNEQYQYLYLLMARRNLDQSIGESKENLVKFNEQISSRYKAGLSFKYLNKYLNDSTVMNSFVEYLRISRLQKTSATDFENIFKKNSPKNIDWFFKNMVNSNEKIDYTFGKTIKNENTNEVTIINKSKSNTPVLITGFKKKEVVFEKWINNIKTDTVISFNKNEVDKLVLNHENFIPEVNKRNNFKSVKRFLSFNRPIKFALLSDMENPKYQQIIYVPEVSFNNYDGAILSLSLSNKLLIDKPFSYEISPSYSAKTNSITGSGGFGLNHQRQNTRLYQIRYSLSGSYYHYIQDAAYLRFTPSVSFRFRDLDLRDNKRYSLNFRQVTVDKEPSPVLKVEKTPLNYSVFDARFNYNDGETAKGFAYGTNLQFSDKFGKLISEIGYRKLFENNYQFSLRLFAGTFLYKKTDSDYYNFGLDRPKDYLFDYNYYGRSENSGILSQQIIIAEGGFKSKFTNPYANQWMTTINATSSIWHWIQMYGDIGLYKNSGQTSKFVYDSGIHFNLVPGYFEVFCPVYSSNGFELNQKNYQEKVRFIVTLSPKTLISLFTRKWF